MREILFRGFHESDGGQESIFINKQEIQGFWVFGYYWSNNLGNHFITVVVDKNDDYCDPADFEIVPETLSQFTGLIDKNGNKIFENDKLRNKGCVYPLIVEYQTQEIINCGCCNQVIAYGYDFSDFNYAKHCEIVGNKFQRSNYENI